jgi:hypothetical protein
VNAPEPEKRIDKKTLVRKYPEYYKNAMNSAYVDSVCVLLPTIKKENVRDIPIYADKMKQKTALLSAASGSLEHEAIEKRYSAASDMSVFLRKERNVINNDDEKQAAIDWLNIGGMRYRKNIAAKIKENVKLFIERGSAKVYSVFRDVRAQVQKIIGGKPLQTYTPDEVKRLGDWQKRSAHGDDRGDDNSRSR